MHSFTPVTLFRDLALTVGPLGPDEDRWLGWLALRYCDLRTRVMVSVDLGIYLINSSWLFITQLLPVLHSQRTSLHACGMQCPSHVWYSNLIVICEKERRERASRDVNKGDYDRHLISLKLIFEHDGTSVARWPGQTLSGSSPTGL